MILAVSAPEVEPDSIYRCIERNDSASPSVETTERIQIEAAEPARLGAHWEVDHDQAFDIHPTCVDPSLHFGDRRARVADASRGADRREHQYRTAAGPAVRARSSRAPRL